MLSATAMGLWIEIPLAGTENASVFPSASAMGLWIEIPFPLGSVLPLSSASAMGLWIEIMLCSTLTTTITSQPLRWGCGLKFRSTHTEMAFDVVSLCDGAVD